MSHQNGFRILSTLTGKSTLCSKVKKGDERSWLLREGKVRIFPADGSKSGWSLFWANIPYDRHRRVENYSTFEAHKSYPNVIFSFSQTKTVQNSHKSIKPTSLLFHPIYFVSIYNAKRAKIKGLKTFSRCRTRRSARKQLKSINFRCKTKRRSFIYELPLLTLHV